MAGLQITVPQSIQLHASSSSRAPEQLKGRVELFVPEPTTISEIIVDFVGVVSGRINGVMASRELCKIGREVSKKKKVDGGLHAFRFAIPVYYNLPCSVHALADGPGRGFAIEYQVHARARLSKPKKSVLETHADVAVSSVHLTTGAPFTVPVKAKNSRQDTIRYEVNVPHAAWAAGTTVRARLSLWIQDPRVKFDGLSASIAQAVSATVKGGEVRFKQDLATHRGLVPGDNIVELAIPSDILLSYNPGASERGVKIDHTLDLLLRFTDQSGRAAVLQSAVPLTLLHKSQKDDALAAGKQVEDWVLHQQAAPTALVTAMPAMQPYGAPYYFPPAVPQQQSHPQQQVYPQQQFHPQQPYAPQPFVAPSANQAMPQTYIAAAPNPQAGWQHPPGGMWLPPSAPQAFWQGPSPAPPVLPAMQQQPAPATATQVAGYTPPIQATSSYTTPAWTGAPQPHTQPPAGAGASHPTWTNLPATYLSPHPPPQQQQQQQDGSSVPQTGSAPLPPGAQPPYPAFGSGQNAQWQ